MKIKVVDLILFFLILILPIDSKSQERLTVKYAEETKDGIKVVHNRLPDRQRIFKQFEFIEDLSIGVEEGEENYMFVNPIDLSVDTHGNIYVLDFAGTPIKKYDEKGKYIRDIARKGQGPGEFQSPRFLEISQQQNIYALDSATRKISVINQEGDYIEMIDTLSPCDRFAITKDEKLIIGFRHTTRNEKDEMIYQYQIGKFNVESKEFTGFFRKEQFKTLRVSNEAVTVEFPNQVRWAKSSEDNIYVATGDKYQISAFSKDGTELFRFTLDVKPEKIEDKIKDVVFGILDRLGKRFNTDPTKKKKLLQHYAFLSYVCFDENDRLWIEKYQPSVRNKPTKETIYDIFTSEGKYLFSTIIGYDIVHRPVFKNGFMYALIRNAMGYTRAVRFKIVNN